MGAKILVVEDEPAIVELLDVNLTSAGYTVLKAGDAATANVILREMSPDLVLVDWGLPGRSGMDFIRAVRRDADTTNLPLIMLTARAADQDKVYGLENGADDYITKPFSPREVIARVNAALRRRSPQAKSAQIKFADLCIDPDLHQVLVGNRPLVMSPTEFRLLHFLMTYPQRVHTRAQLLDKVWGTGSYVEERSVDAYVGRLRSLLEPGGHAGMIETVRGVGYRFSCNSGAQ